MNKGDIVRIKATVEGRTVYYSAGRRREIRRMPEPKNRNYTGIVLGYSFIRTGEKVDGKYYDDPNYLRIEKHHRVIVVEPFEQDNTWWHGDKFKTNRYLKSVRCLEEDLELMEEKKDERVSQN